MCGEVKAGPSENEEIQFLCTVCAKLKMDPYLVNFFIEVCMQFTSEMDVRLDLLNKGHHKLYIQPLE